MTHNKWIELNMELLGDVAAGSRVVGRRTLLEWASALPAAYVYPDPESAGANVTVALANVTDSELRGVLAARLALAGMAMADPQDAVLALLDDQEVWILGCDSESATVVLVGRGGGVAMLVSPPGSLAQIWGIATAVAEAAEARILARREGREIACAYKDSGVYSVEAGVGRRLGDAATLEAAIELLLQGHGLRGESVGA